MLHAKSIKLSVVQGLFLRALRICSPDFLDDEINFIFSSFTKLAYPNYVLKTALSKAKSTYYKSNPRPKFKGSTFCFPYVPSLDTATHSRIASVLNSRIVFSYPNKVKSKLVHNNPQDNTQSGVYRVNCNDCETFYVGETGRSLSTRIREHKNDFIKHNLNNAMYVHAIENNHTFNLNGSSLIAPCNDLQTRKILESSLICHHNDNV